MREVEVEQRVAECREYVAELDDLARPVNTVVIDEMPREGMGKIAYKKLSEKYNAEEEAKRAQMVS